MVATFKGTLEIFARGDVYQFRWNAGTQYDGVGVANATSSPVAFASGANGKGCGVVDYNIQDDSTLDGKWGLLGNNQAGTEKAMRTADQAWNGEYDATGKNPDGKEYKAKLTVDPPGTSKICLSNNSAASVSSKETTWP